MTEQQNNEETTPTQPKDEAVITAQPESAPQAEESKEDPNWRAFREARKRDRAEKEAAIKRAEEEAAKAEAFKAAFEAAFGKQPPVTPQQVTDSYYQEETEDERIEKKVRAALAAKEEEERRLQQQREQQEYPQRLQQAYPDFSQVINDTNLDYLEYHYPEVAAPLKRLPDGYDKWADIYRAVKKFVPNHQGAKKDMARAEANFQKPKSISSTGMSQAAEAPTPTRLSEERKAANWERMQRTLKGLT